MNVVNLKILFLTCPFSYQRHIVITFQQLVHAHLIYIKETIILAIVMLERIDCDDTTGVRDVKHVIQNNDWKLIRVMKYGKMYMNITCSIIT